MNRKNIAKAVSGWPEFKKKVTLTKFSKDRNLNDKYEIIKTESQKDLE